PELGGACCGKMGALAAIKGGGGRGKNFDDQIGCAVDAVVTQPVVVFAGDVEHVGLIDVVIVEVDVAGRAEHGAEGGLLKEIVEEAQEVLLDKLMKDTGGW